MPDYTVKADVDTMLRANDKAAIRSAIGVGTTDAPTFLAQTLTGQSLTGTQATSLVDLSATWNTTGTPSALKLNVTDTASNAASKLIDLRLSNLDRFVVKKDGTTTIGGTDVGSQHQMLNLQNQYGNVGFLVGGGGRVGLFSGYEYASFFPSGVLTLNGASSYLGIGPNLAIHRDGADGILAQRNGTAKQTLRIYNTYTSASIYERAVMDWNGPTPGNLQIGTEFLGSGSGMAARPIDFVTGGVVRMSIGDTGITTFNGTVSCSSLLQLTGAGGIRLPSTGYGIYWNTSTTFKNVANGVLTISNFAENDFNRLQLGGTTSAFPAIKRSGTGIHIVLADDSAFAPLSAGAISSGAVGLIGSITALNSVGASAIQISGNVSYGCHMAAGVAVSWGSGASLNGSLDTALVRPAGGTVKITDGSTGTGTIIAKLPTSSAGLASGTVWNNAGVVSIIP